MTYGLWKLSLPLTNVTSDLSLIVYLNKVHRLYAEHRINAYKQNMTIDDTVPPCYLTQMSERAQTVQYL